MLRLRGIIVFVFALCVACNVHAAETLDIKSELSRPGVKLVVVEYFATWCKPCMAAVPKWKALHEKYASRGLRFIVVSAEGNQTCSRTPDWSPDVSLCDKDGALQEAMQVTQLPTSFLYSWDGAIHLKSYDVKPVEQAIERYFQNVHLSMIVDEVEVHGDKLAIGSNEQWVRESVVSHIKTTSKFDVVEPSRDPIERYKAGTCSTNPVLPVNSVMRILLQGHDDGKRFLSLSIEKDGCTIAKNQQPYAGKGMQEDKASLQMAVEKAVQATLGQVIFIRPPEEFIGDGFLFVESDPDGAMVYINGEMYSSTPFQQKFPVGHYTVEVRNGHMYKPAREQIVLTGETKHLTMKLEPDYGILSVSSTPKRADIFINGEPTGFKTPHVFPRRKGGQYRVTLHLEHYGETTKEVRLGDGKRSELHIDLPENFAELTVKSTPSGGTIFLNNQNSGQVTPFTFTPLKLGSWDVEVRLDGHNPASQLITLAAGQREAIALKPEPRYGWLEVLATLCDDATSQCTATQATVYVDGKESFAAPGRTRVQEGRHHIKVEAPGGGAPFLKNITVMHQKTTEIAARVAKGSGVSKLQLGGSASSTSAPAPSDVQKQSDPKAPDSGIRHHFTLSYNLRVAPGHSFSESNFVDDSKRDVLDFTEYQVFNGFRLGYHWLWRFIGFSTEFTFGYAGEDGKGTVSETSVYQDKRWQIEWAMDYALTMSLDFTYKWGFFQPGLSVGAGLYVLEFRLHDDDRGIGSTFDYLSGVAFVRPYMWFWIADNWFIHTSYRYDFLPYSTHGAEAGIGVGF